MMEDGKGSTSWAVSRGVQVGFLVGLLALWYVATNYWGVSRVLLPEPVAVFRQFIDILTSGEFVDDLKVTLGEVAAAFALSSTIGLTLGYLISRSQYAIRV